MSNHIETLQFLNDRCWTELNWTNLQQVDPVTRRVIGHARHSRDVD